MPTVINLLLITLIAAIVAVAVVVPSLVLRHTIEQQYAALDEILDAIDDLRTSSANLSLYTHDAIIHPPEKMEEKP